MDVQHCNRASIRSLSRRPVPGNNVKMEGHAHDSKRESCVREMVSEVEMVSDRSRLNGVYRLIRKKELQRNLMGSVSPRGQEEGLMDGTLGDDHRASVIKADDLVGERSKLNPVYRLIRRKELRLRYPTPSTPYGDEARSDSTPQLAKDKRYRRITSPASPLLSTSEAQRDLSRAMSIIGENELASKEAKMNPVFRLIRKKELSKRFLASDSPSMNHGGLGDLYLSGFDPFGSTLLPDPLKDAYLSTALDPGGGDEKNESQDPVFVTGNSAVDRTIRIRQIVMRLRTRKEIKMKAQQSPLATSIPQVPWLLLEAPSGVVEGKMSQSQNKRLKELRESKKVGPVRPPGVSYSLTLVEKALGVKSSAMEWKDDVARNLTPQSIDELQKLQDEFPRLDVGRLLGIKIKGKVRFQGKGPALDESSPVAKVQSLLRLLDKLGVPGDLALSFVSKELDALIQGGRTSLNNADKVGAKLAGLSAVLGGVSMESSLAFATLQPSALNRKPSTLEGNMVALVEILDMSRSRVEEMVVRYPPLIELNSGTVREHLLAIRGAVLSAGPHSSSNVTLLKEALYSCPSLLGMKPQSMRAKVDVVKAGLALLYSSAAKVSGVESPKAEVQSLLLGYPQLLAIGKETLEEKFKRLTDTCCGKESWANEVLSLKPKSLGRILGAGSSVMSRLNYFIETGDIPVRPDPGGEGRTVHQPLGLLKLVTLSSSEFNNCFPRFVLRG